LGVLQRPCTWGEEVNSLLAQFAHELYSFSCGGRKMPKQHLNNGMPLENVIFIVDAYWTFYAIVILLVLGLHLDF
jgi:hypothetical protein